MKNYKYILGKLWISGLMACMGTACNDYDIADVPYEKPDSTEVIPITPPAISPEWGLEPISNAGQQAKGVFAYKDKKFDKLFTRYLGWNGGDGVYSTALPDGNTFWSFCDSFYGTVEEGTRMRPADHNNFPRNSIMVQTGEDQDNNLVWLADYIQTAHPDKEGYYKARTYLRHPLAKLTDEEIRNGKIDEDYVYWFGDATVYPDEAGVKTLQIIWGGVDLKNNNAPAGCCLTEHILEGKPGDGTYMKLVSRDDNFHADQKYYGNTLYEDEDGHTYLYGQGSNYEIIVARSRTHDLKSPWEYYIRNVDGDFEWQTTPPGNMEIERSGIAKECSLANVFKKEDTYYMVGQGSYFDKAVYIYRSETPYGPFTDKKVLFVVPGTIDKLGDQHLYTLYNIFLHPQFSRVGEMVFSINASCEDFLDNFNRTGSADFYRPYFFRVFNWENVYEE